jgi:hypothetical protein
MEHHYVVARNYRVSSPGGMASKDVITDVFGGKCPSGRPFRPDVRGRRPDVRPRPQLHADAGLPADAVKTASAR